MTPVMTFWIAAGALMVLVIAGLTWPLLRRAKGNQSDRVAINAAIYRDEMAELEKDRQTGSLSEEDYRVARGELERRVLEDTAGGASAPQPGIGKGVPKTAMVLLVLVPLLAIPLYFTFGNPEGLTAEAGGAKHVSSKEIEEMVGKLEARMAQNPEDKKGWLMLARSYKAMNRFDAAEKAYGHLKAEMESDSALMLEWVGLQAYKNQGRIEGEALAKLNAVLKKEPQNPEGLMLLGTAAFYKGDPKSAIATWEKLLALLPPGSEDAASVLEGINAAKEKLGEKPVVAPPAAAGKPSPAGEAKAGAGAGLVGTVELSAALKSKVAPDDVLFVFARAVEGPRMPLAVVRAKASELPLAFSLDDSMAMQPDLKLSNFTQVRIEARIAKSGDAMTKPGDLVGNSAPVAPGAKGVKVVIDQVVK